MKSNTRISPFLPTAGLLALLIFVAAYLYFFTDSQIEWGGYFSMMIFYALIFLAGTYAAKLRDNNNTDGILLAGRNVPIGIAVFTMSATWIGGGFINGTAEFTANPDFGLVWVQAPWGYALSLIVGGLFFARKMRHFRFKTMLDPLEQRFGKGMAAVLFLPALSGEIFWTAAILTALGTTFGTILGIATMPAIVLSAVIAITYTALGGLWAVALTDVIQLVLLFIGLGLVVPYALDSVGGLEFVLATYSEKFGSKATFLPSEEALGAYYWTWWDTALLLTFGGIPWQVYFQRVLSSKDEKTAVRLSILAGFVCLLAAIPAVLIGMVGATADWSAMGLNAPPDAASTLPHVVRYLTNPWVATIGLGAIAAAVMSSVDSSILSASSMAGWNVIRPLFRRKMSSVGLGKVIKKCIWIIGIAATLLALKIESVYELWYLCSDFVYCLLFPQLVCALFDKKANIYGSIAGFAVAFILRFGGGDVTLGIPVFIDYEFGENAALFPFKTLSMVSGWIAIIVVSRITQKFAEAKSLFVVD